MHFEKILLDVSVFENVNVAGLRQTNKDDMSLGLTQSASGAKMKKNNKKLTVPCTIDNMTFSYIHVDRFD